MGHVISFSFFSPPDVGDTKHVKCACATVPNPPPTGDNLEHLSGKKKYRSSQIKKLQRCRLIATTLYFVNQQIKFSYHWLYIYSFYSSLENKSTQLKRGGRGSAPTSSALCASCDGLQQRQVSKVIRGASERHTG